MFDFSDTKEYRENKPQLSESGYVTAEIKRCEYNDRYESIGIDIENDSVVCNYLSMYLKNRKGENDRGYFQFMAICKLLGVDKPSRNEFDRFEDIEGKTLTFGIKLQFNAGQQFPKAFIQSIHDPKTGKTYGEILEGKEADTIKRELKNSYKGFDQPADQGGTGEKDFGEPPAGIDDEGDLPF